MGYYFEGESTKLKEPFCFPQTHNELHFSHYYYYFSTMSTLMPQRKSHPSYHKLLPYLAFLIFGIFVFKLDIFIYQTASAARRNVYGARPTLVVGNSFHRDFIESWGTGRGARALEEGERLTLTLDQQSGSGFESKKVFLFAKITMQIKLVPGNSAGTVTTYYLSSEGEQYDKIEFQFLGNISGNPYTVHTNVYTQGKADREQQFFLWFDPTLDFHTYSFLWNPKCIIFYVDDIPIREFKNAEHLGVPFPKNEPMRIYSGVWNADDWATQGGRVKIDWSAAPFTVTYTKFSADGCIWSFRTRTSSCSPHDFSTKPVLNEELDQRSRDKMKKLHREYMVYDYCKDKLRFPNGTAPECSIN